MPGMVLSVATITGRIRCKDQLLAESVSCTERSGDARLLWRSKAIIRICLAVLFPECSYAWMLEENLHAPMPGFPNTAVNIAGLIKKILLRTEIEVAEQAFLLVGR